jgi:hypothetical protein
MRKKFHMHLRNISRKLVTNTNTAELISAVMNDDIDRVHEHLRMKLVKIAESSQLVPK